MSISPAQCRAARALLSWSQEELEARSRVAKKTIADFERGARYPHDRTGSTLQSTLESFGVVFIPAGEGGEGVRLREAMPRLFRRSDVPHREWIAFAFDYKDKRYTGFALYGALAYIALDEGSPLEIFDRDRERLLIRAAEKVDSQEFDAEGRVLIRQGDLKRVEFNF